MSALVPIPLAQLTTPPARPDTEAPPSVILQQLDDVVFVVVELKVCLGRNPGDGGIQAFNRDTVLFWPSLTEN